MFRRLLLGGAASLALLSPMALPSAADAHEHHYRRHEHHRRACRVYYRDPCRPGLVFAGSCYGHREAERLAAPYRCRGFEIVIR
jgi:hypothetical protein